MKWLYVGGIQFVLYKSRHPGVIITVQHLVTRAVDSMACRTKRFTVGRASRGARTRPGQRTRLPHPAYSCCFIGVGIRGSALVTQPTSTAPTNWRWHTIDTVAVWHFRIGEASPLTGEKHKKELINHNSLILTFSNIDSSAVITNVFHVTVDRLKIKRLYFLFSFTKKRKKDITL